MMTYHIGPTLEIKLADNRSQSKFPRYNVTVRKDENYLAITFGGVAQVILSWHPTERLYCIQNK